MAMNPRLLRPRQSGFDPKSISGLAAWWDAADSSSLTLDGSGNVSSWADKSGNGVTASQGTANNRPRPTAAALNGKQVLTFDGANDALSFTGTARTDETAVVLLYANLPAAGQIRQASYLGNASSHGLIVTVKNDGGSNDVFGYLGGFTAPVTLRWTSAGGVALGPIVTTIVRSAASGGVLFVNGTQRATCTTSNSFAMNQIGLTTSSPSGYIAEVCIYSRALSASERQRVERYLGAKWGLSVA